MRHKELLIIAIILSVSSFYIVLGEANNGLKMDNAITVLSIFITILIGWNVYAIIDVKGVKKDIDAQIKNLSERTKSEIENELSSKLDERFRDYIENKFQKERVVNSNIELYKYAYNTTKDHPENSFRIFIKIADECEQLNERNFALEAVTRASEIVSNVNECEYNGNNSFSEAAKKLKDEKREQFYKMARSFMDKYMKKPLLPNSLFDKEDLEELSKFIDEKYNASNRQ